MTAPLFKGVITALITPLRDGNVDEAAFKRLLERQIAAGVHGVVPMGTTGESATLHLDEHKRVVEQCVEIAAGRTISREPVVYVRNILKYYTSYEIYREAEGG